jgi:parallel beta-helix repeat protein
MKLTSANTTTITDNLLTAPLSYGIYMSLCGNVDVINNTLLDNSFGIYAAHSANILIQDNQVSGSTYAIELYDSYSSTILHNTVSDNPTYSVYIVHSQSNSVTNNTVSRNDWGVTLYNSSLNTLEGNTISHNTFGITTAYSSDNIIYHNNFINNVNQIYRDFPSINTWSQGGEGNHWSTYQGEDDGSGGRVAMDGIGDTLIPHQGEDFYPLMQAYGNILGDVNVDGIVDIFDIGYISAHWYPGPPEGPLGYDANSDINYDGVVDIFDIGICSAHMGETA